MPFISSNALSGPPKPASASATIGASQVTPPGLAVAVAVPVDLPVAVRSRSVQRLGVVDLVRAQQSLVQATHGLGHAVRRVEALVGVGLPRQVGVSRHLPAAQIDGLEPGAHLLHRLAAGQGAERRDVIAA